MLMGFTYDNPTRIHFGRDADNLSGELVQYGGTVLLVYGKNAIKKNGLFCERGSGWPSVALLIVTGMIVPV